MKLVRSRQSRYANLGWLFLVCATGLSLAFGIKQLRERRSPTVHVTASELSSALASVAEHPGTGARLSMHGYYVNGSGSSGCPRTFRFRLIPSDEDGRELELTVRYARCDVPLRTCDLPGFDYPLGLTGRLTTSGGEVLFEADKVSLRWTGAPAAQATLERACRAATAAARRSCALCSPQPLQIP